jgi:PPOX class probable F420-dependent enzyme
MQTWERALIEQQRVAHLATVDAQGQPSVVPVVYAFDGQQMFTPLDGKPKRTPLAHLRRVQDIAANPQVALVIDQYDLDWTKLAWVQVRGLATLLTEGEIYGHAIALLMERYPQYQTIALAGLPLMAITPTATRSWRFQSVA